MRCMKKLLPVLIVITLLIIGVVFYRSSFIQPYTASMTAEKSVLPQTLISTQDLEKFLAQNTTSSEVKGAYRFAVKNPDGVLSKARCYCGCLKQGHKNNRDCFVNEDGTLDLMGLNCGLCVRTALVSKEMLAQGKTVWEISDYVDARWGNADN